ncbi:unnamed protein product [Discula destructiva]
MRLFDFYDYNPSTERFDLQPPDGNVVKGNLCPEADPSQPFWDLAEPEVIVIDDEPPPYDEPPSELPPTFWREMAHTLWADSTPPNGGVDAGAGTALLQHTESTPHNDAIDYIADSAPFEDDSPAPLGDGGIDVIESEPLEDHSPTLLGDGGFGLIESEPLRDDSPAPFGDGAIDLIAGAHGKGDLMEPREEATQTPRDFTLCVSPKDVHRAVPDPDDPPSFFDEDPFGSALAESDGESDGEGSTASANSDADESLVPAETPSGEWEAFKIIGEELINDETHYMVAWKPTLEPESNLGHLATLIAEWKTRARSSRPAQHRSGKIRKIRINLRAPQPQVKRGRGRPPKQRTV